MKKSDAKPNIHKPEDDPVEALLLLSTSDASFQRIVGIYRKACGIIPPWEIKKDDDYRKAMEAAMVAVPLIIKDFNLPPSPSIRARLFEFFISGKLEVKGSKRYKILADPVIEYDGKGKPLSNAISVSLVTYAKLSAKEEQQAEKELHAVQNLLFPPWARRSVKGIKAAAANLELETAMKSRIRPHIEEQYVSQYTQEAQKQYSAGKITKEQFKEMIRKNPQGILKIRAGRTSEEIARKHLGIKGTGSTARKRTSRLKKLRKDLLQKEL